MKNILIKYENFILAAIYTFIFGLFVVLRYDFYYALNDDVLIKDLLAGIYTGTPESRNIQMLYPLSAVISLLYRMIPQIPWYALFLCFCQFGSIFLIAISSLKFFNSTSKKALFLFFQAVVLTATMLEHFVFVQYTITSAILTTAAVFYFITAKTKETTKSFMKSSIPAVVLILTAFLLRPWMLLLLLPFVGVAGFYKWGQEKPLFTKQNFTKYILLLGMLILTLMLLQAVDMIAHSSPEWKKFNQLFANRTELYDFHEPPDYDENVIFYNSIGFTYGEVKLLKNYNYGLSQKIDEVTLGEVAEYAAKIRASESSWNDRLNKQLRLYYYNMTHGGEHGDFPYNSLVILGYAALLGFGIFYNQLARIGTLLFLIFGVRSSLWLFILMRGRNPDRINHSLYFIEMGILLAIILNEIRKIGALESTNEKKGFSRFVDQSFPLVLVSVAMLIVIGNIPAMIQKTDHEQLNREKVNQTWIAMQEYCANQAENFYFIDVYSSVHYSEKLFAKAIANPANYDIMGGWATKSPLYTKKLARFIDPFKDMFTALLSDDSIYFIIEQGHDTAWLADYYLERGEIVTMELADTIASNKVASNDVAVKLEVYKLR